MARADSFWPKFGPGRKKTAQTHPYNFMFFFSRLHGKDNVAIKRYVISFWNGIDLRYKLLKDPGVKISIAGIIISRVSIIFPFFREINLILSCYS